MKNKIKTKSAAKKRFRLTKSGKVKFKHAFGRHNLLGKSQNRKRKYRKACVAHETNMSEMIRMMPYGRPC